MSSAQTASDDPAYIDASAFLRLVLKERESAALAAFLQRERRHLAASAVLEVEAGRAAGLVGSDALSLAAAHLGSVELIEVTPAIRMLARAVGPTSLRTLDAIHLATAIEIGAREMLVYDQRLADAATAYGLSALSPGA